MSYVRVPPPRLTADVESKTRLPGPVLDRVTAPPLVLSWPTARSLTVAFAVPVPVPTVNVRVPVPVRFVVVARSNPWVPEIVRVEDGLMFRVGTSAVSICVTLMVDWPVTSIVLLRLTVPCRPNVVAAGKAFA